MDTNEVHIIELVPTDFTANYPDVLESDAGYEETVVFIPADYHALKINFEVAAHLDGLLVVLSFGSDVNTRVVVECDVRLKHLDHSCEVLVRLLRGYCKAETFLLTASNVAVIAAKKTRHDKLNGIRR